MISKIKKFIKRKLFFHLWNNKGVFPYYQHQVYFPKNSIIFRRAINDGIYEYDNVKIINTLVKENSTVFDIGANIGLMALPILNSFQNVKVISVEPSPNSFPYLFKTQQHSKFKNNWSLINKATSSEVGKVNFQLADPNNAAYESILNTNRANFVATVEVECSTIDTLWDEQNQPQISFIKIDIEGADLLALKGATTCIEKCKPAILMEWNKTNILPFKVNNTDLLNFTKKINYAIFALPYFTKCTSVSDLDLLYQFDENFLLIPNE